MNHPGYYLPSEVHRALLQNLSQQPLAVAIELWNILQGLSPGQPMRSSEAPLSVAVSGSTQDGKE